jgi:hypothetical protein
MDVGVERPQAGGRDRQRDSHHRWGEQGEQEANDYEKEDPETLGDSPAEVAGHLRLVDRDQAAAARGVEPNGARNRGEEGVIAAPANAHARMDPGPSLADDDRSGLDARSAERLYAEPLGLAVPAVPGRRCTLLVRHGDLRIPALG